MLSFKRGLAYLTTRNDGRSIEATRLEFAHLPGEIVREILRLLPLRQQLKCEEVCKRWMMILRGLDDDTAQHRETPVGTGELSIILRGPDSAGGPLHLQEEDDQDGKCPVITIAAADQKQSPTESAFLRWFARVAPTVAIVTVSVDHVDENYQANGLQDYNGGWVFPRLLAALQAARQPASSGPMLKLATGSDLFLNQPFAITALKEVLVYWELGDIGNDGWEATFANITQLTMLTRLMLCDPSGTFCASDQDMHELLSLPALQEVVLHSFDHLARRVPSFTNLQSLVLEHGLDTFCDLSSLTFLTALEFVEEAAGDHLKQILLPCGRDVRLQYLECNFVHAKDAYQMQNLESASQLTHLHFSGVSPEGLKLNAWPIGMTSLKQLAFCNCSTGFPVSICSCIQLQFLDLANIRDVTLPDGFSASNELQVLSLRGCQFDMFPLCILSLSQLQILDMGHLHRMTLPAEVVVCAEWPDLTLLDLSLFGDEIYDMDSQLALLCLDNAFKARNKKSPLIVNDIYLNRS